MGGVFLEEDSVEDASPDPYPYGSAFEKQFPYFLSLGMTWEEYWHGDNTLPGAYFEKFKIERDRENHYLWRQGLYVRAAIGSVMSEKNKYPNEPYPLTEEQAKEQKEREFKRKAEMFRSSLIVEQRTKNNA